MAPAMRTVFAVAACAVVLTRADEACSEDDLLLEEESVMEEDVQLIQVAHGVESVKRPGHHKHHQGHRHQQHHRHAQDPLLGGDIEPVADDSENERRPGKDQLHKIAAEFKKEGANFTQLWSRYGKELHSLVPKEMKPLSLEEVHTLNRKAKVPASMLAEDVHRELKEEVGTNSSFTPVPYFNPATYPWTFCGSSNRFDIQATHGDLSVEQCYIFSCVEPFVASTTCGGTFYTNGGGNCKCCGYGSNYYISNSYNRVFTCR